MRIIHRIFLGYAGVLLLMLGLAVVAVVQVNSISASLGIINDVNSVKQRYAINFRGSVHDRAISIRDVVLFETDAERDAAIKEIRQLEAFYAEAATGMQEIFAARNNSTAEELEILAAIQKTEAETLPLIEQIIGLRRDGDVVQAHEILMDEARPLFIRWLAQINQFIDLQEEFNRAEGTEVRNTADGFQLFMFAAFSIALLLALALGAWAVAAFRPLRASTDAMRRLAAGDLSVDIPTTKDRHEVGDIIRSLETFKSSAVEKEQMGVRQAERDRQAAEEKREDMRRLAESFKTSVGTVIEGVSASALELQETAKTMSSTAEQANALATSVGTASDDASTNVQTVASATEELSASIGEITRQISDSNSISRRAVETAEATNTKVAALAEGATKIGNIVSLIQEIAEQTNLLALNATIEAARAGDAGKGFAVVASEVKNLANQTAKATDEISAQVTAMQGSTTDTVAAIEEITSVIRQINENAGGIASAVEQQNASTQEIARNVQEASAATNKVTTTISDVRSGATSTGQAAKEVLTRSETLSNQSQALRVEVDKFLAELQAS
ncbi:methyl-accepting chemotaxis protein [Thalassobaculum sp. OXR-137]|uniref:methyl-accepting chemotaxis protein n=1 Tax=Thalassobaculum sp. OXR-137 TaxID=3100173 RepID=UPI002AC9DD95|nr:methyl-accepting chemotaxis protein [Thalassobaculum sp. OXR-137]WPZ35106.1 methyl-accepting chemotaxis protein [Thalassobaculum sp. OXR-137]